MLEPKAMKIIAPARCPHCGEEIIISQNMVTPVVGWVLKKEDIIKAKERVKTKVIQSNLPEPNKQEIVAWIDNDETMFGPEEVETLIGQLLGEKKEEEPKEEDETN